MEQKKSIPDVQLRPASPRRFIRLGARDVDPGVVAKRIAVKVLDGDDMPRKLIIEFP
jgi:hypothetical protein